MSRWEFLRRLSPVWMPVHILGFLLCLELPPAKVLPAILRISPLISLEPEPKPIDIALHRGPAGLRTIRLMPLFRVEIELDWIG